MLRDVAGWGNEHGGCGVEQLPAGELFMAARVFLVLAILCVAGCAAEKDRMPFDRYLHQKGYE